MQRSVCVYTALYNAFSSWFTAGALARVNVKQARVIHDAVIKEDWQTASHHLCMVRQGKLSGSADPLASNYCMMLTSHGAPFSGF